jgi:hypothetical protein
MTKRSLTVLVAMLAAVAVAMPATALASDASSTQAYLQANYQLVSYFSSHLRAAEAEDSGILAGVRRECPGAAAESPQDVDSEQLSNEVIGTMVTTVIQHHLAALQRFTRAVAHLRWSDAALTRAIRSYAAKGEVLSSLAVPRLCADVKAWVVGDYKTLPASTVSFDRRFMPAWVAPGELPRSLAAYETPEDRALAQRTHHLEQQWTEFEAREVETWGRIMDSMEIQP